MKWKVGDEAYLKGRKNGKGWPLAGVVLVVCGEALLSLCDWLEQKALEWHFRALGRIADEALEQTWGIHNKGQV